MCSMIGGFWNTGFFTTSDSKFPAKDIGQAMGFVWPGILKPSFHEIAGSSSHAFQGVYEFFYNLRNFDKLSGLIGVVRILTNHSHLIAKS